MAAARLPGREERGRGGREWKKRGGWGLKAARRSWWKGPFEPGPPMQPVLQSVQAMQRSDDRAASHKALGGEEERAAAAAAVAAVVAAATVTRHTHHRLPPLILYLAGNILMGAVFYSLIFMLIGK